MKPIIAVPATAALVYRAWSRKSLTPLGIAVAFITAVVHALHPWSAPFALLVIFFIGGTTATKVQMPVKPIPNLVLTTYRSNMTSKPILPCPRLALLEAKAPELMSRS